MPQFSELLAELKRRNVYRVVVGYAAIGFAVLQGADLILAGLGGPSWLYPTLVVLFLVGFVPAATLAWIYEVRDGEVLRTASEGVDDGDQDPVLAKPKRRLPALCYSGLVAAAVGAGALLWWYRPALLGSNVVPGTDVIAVAPFTTRSSDAAFLGEGIVDLMSPTLDQVGDIRMISPSSIHRAWREMGTPSEWTDEDVAELAQRVEAGSVLVGTIVEAGREVRIDAELRSRDGRVVARSRTSGATEDAISLVDSLSNGLLRAIWHSHGPPPHLNVGAITTNSVDAIREYLRGERYFRASQFDSAVVAFGRAVALDSTFAQAYGRQATSIGWRIGPDAQQDQSERLDAIRAAARHIERLPVGERTLVGAQLLHAERYLAEAADSAAAYAATHRDDAWGAILAADYRYHAWEQGLRTGAPYEGVEQILSIDSTYAPALSHAIWEAAYADDRVQYERLVRLYRRGGGTEPDRMEASGRVLFEAGLPLDSAARLIQHADPLPLALAISGTLAGLDRDPFPLLDALVASESSRPEYIGIAMLGLVATGQFQRARGFAPGHEIPLGFQALAISAGVADSTDFPEAYARTRDRWGDWPLLWLDLANGRLESAAARAAILMPTDSFPDHQAPFVAGARGLLQVMQGDTAAGVPALRESWNQVRTGPVGAAFGEDPFLVAWALFRTEASWSQSRPEGLEQLKRYEVPYPLSAAHLAVSHLWVGKALELAGNYREAQIRYERFLFLFQRADPQLDRLKQQAEEGIARIQARPAA